MPATEMDVYKNDMKDEAVLDIILERQHEDQVARSGLPEEEAFWMPLEELCGIVNIRSKASLETGKIRITFEGLSRVYTRRLSETKLNKIDTYVAKYKFLSQQYEIEDFQNSIESSTGIFIYSARFSFTISRWALTKGLGVPQQCLDLPPSFCAGQTLVSGDDEYAQPNITYHLVKEGIHVADSDRDKASFENS
ncbi:hypothetical protein LTR93_012128 [Exophiala xenobiotica]|nr:hypothetical protein LTR93_012128 [Exophiala xenobiotica]KAK5399957.1 hypothetical protein LTR06_011388 [Exophiala xenobiotica]